MGIESNKEAVAMMKNALGSIENRFREAYNKGYKDGLRDGASQVTAKLVSKILEETEADIPQTEREGEYMAVIYLGNLSIDDIEKRTGIAFSDEHKKYMNEHRQMEVNSTPIKKGFWHGFDIPFMIMTSDKETAKEYVDMLSAYDWSKCKEPLRIGY